MTTDTATTPKYEPGTHPDLEPPMLTSGPIFWLKENLFGSITSTILTLVAFYLLYLILPPLFQWAFLDATLNAASRTECQELGEGACWAFIKERFLLLVYGFYPIEERWRPNLTFILLCVAIASVLWDQMPARRHFLKFAAVYPFIAAWLLLGGEWAIFDWRWLLLTAVLIAACVAVVRNPNLMPAENARVLIWATVVVGLLTLLLRLGGTISLAGLVVYEPWLVDSGLKQVTTDQFGGILLTIVIGITGISFSLPIGVVLALGRQGHLPIVRIVCVMFIEFIRGVPLITLLFVASTMLTYFLPPGTEFNLLLRVLIMVTLFASAYMAEVIRGGLQAIPKGQYEAADSMGLKYWQSMRLIILPQALKISIPGIVNTFIGLYKDTTLVVVIGLLDPLGVADMSLADNKWQGLSNEIYIFIALFFFVCCFSMSRYSLYLENKLHTGHKR